MSSFQNVVSKALEINKSTEDSSLLETEDKFATLSLAFKTDRQTLEKRIELHQRARDIAEGNIQKELEGLKDGMKTLSQLCNNKTSNDVFSNIQHHMEVLQQSIARMSSRAEVHGAVQQEMRVSQAIDVMVLHVENLKRTYQKEHSELEEARKSLLETKHEPLDQFGNEIGPNRSGLSSSVYTKGGLRRASIAVISKTPMLPRKSSSPLFHLPENDVSTRSVTVNNTSVADTLLGEHAIDQNTITNGSDNGLRKLVRQSSYSVLENSRPTTSDEKSKFTISPHQNAMLQRAYDAAVLKSTARRLNKQNSLAAVDEDDREPIDELPFRRRSDATKRSMSRSQSVLKPVSEPSVILYKSKAVLTTALTYSRPLLQYILSDRRRTIVSAVILALVLFVLYIRYYFFR